MGVVGGGRGGGWGVWRGGGIVGGGGVGEGVDSLRAFDLGGVGGFVFLCRIGEVNSFVGLGVWVWYELSFGCLFCFWVDRGIYLRFELIVMCDFI